VTNRTIRAFVLTGPREGGVQDVPAPIATRGEAVVNVERVGICGTDAEFFTGEMAYLRDGQSHYPMRLGHEWCGRVSVVGEGVDPGWIGRRVTGDTMIGDGRCRRCRLGNHHVCDHRLEIGIRDGCDGALAEQLSVPVKALHPLPDAVDAVLGALVEPAGNALRAAQAADVGTGDRALVLGPGTIGLLVAMFLRAMGTEVHVMGETASSIGFARGLGFEHAWTESEVPLGLPFDAVIDASTAADLPALALDLVEPAGRVVFIGLAGVTSSIDTRKLVLKDVTAIGILSASPCVAAAIQALATGVIDPRPLVAATVGLDQVNDVLAGGRPTNASPGPKIHVDPRSAGAQNSEPRLP
jgi:threonine dehydrogenase-like Zn-dependent dehydrogenase